MFCIFFANAATEVEGRSYAMTFLEIIYCSLELMMDRPKNSVQVQPLSFSDFHAFSSYFTSKRNDPRRQFAIPTLPTLHNEFELSLRRHKRLCFYTKS